jgi:hypothetical protein
MRHSIIQETHFLLLWYWLSRALAVTLIGRPDRVVPPLSPMMGWARGGVVDGGTEGELAGAREGGGSEPPSGGSSSSPKEASSVPGKPPVGGSWIVEVSAGGRVHRSSSSRCWRTILLRSRLVEARECLPAGVWQAVSTKARSGGFEKIVMFDVELW